MPKKQPSMPGKLVFSVSFDDRNGERFYHVFYDKEADQNGDTSIVVGAMLRLGYDFPELIEPICLVASELAQELVKPFNDILNEKGL